MPEERDDEAAGGAAGTVQTQLAKRERESKPRLANAPDFGPRYRVTGVLGKGGMGEVFRAYDADLREEVALKVVHSDQSELDAHGRFRREIALARKVTDPNVLRVYDLGDYEGLRFLSMEYVDGESLAALLRRERIPLELGLVIFRQVCKGLVAAHAQGVIHRDLKPQNVLLDKQGRVRVADFGLARSIGESGLTASGAVIGSPAYMSPEQVKGDPVDERSDIYSLGVMLYQLISGETPFRADTPHAVMEMRLHKKPKPLREVALDAPAYLEAVVARCLAVDPDQRFASVTELLAALEAQTTSRAATRTRWMLPVVAAGVVGAIAIGAVVLWPSTTDDKPRADPVSRESLPATAMPRVLLLGIENRTGDPLFDQTLETVLRFALRRSTKVDPLGARDLRALAGTFGDDTHLDEKLVERVAERDGGTVFGVRGAIASKGSGFELSLVVTDPRGEKVFTRVEPAASFENVIAATGRLASGLRAHLGESIDDAEREQTGLSPKLHAARAFTVGFATQQAGDDDGAITNLEKAIAVDADFALAHAVVAVSYENRARTSDAAAARKRVLGSLDRMGERDRLKFLGDYHTFTTEEHDRGVAAYEELLRKWPTDRAAINNLALAYLHRPNAKKALEISTRSLAEHPYDYRIGVNHAQYELNAGLFEKAVVDTRAAIKRFPRVVPNAHLYLAVGLLVTGKRQEALEAYDVFAKALPDQGRLALADLAMSEGRLPDAARLLAMEVPENRDLAEVQYMMSAELKLRRGDKTGAKADAALMTGLPRRAVNVAFTLIAVGDEQRALALAAKFAEDVSPARRASALLIEAEAARVRSDLERATATAREALELSDSVTGRDVLARALLDAGKFADAKAELETCIARRGELMIDPDDVPRLRYVNPLSYYLARALEGLGSPDASKTYTAFLALMVDPDPTDTLVIDARKRISATSSAK